jgi:hypothetical protein
MVGMTEHSTTSHFLPVVCSQFHLYQPTKNLVSNEDYHVVITADNHATGGEYV